MTTPTDQTSKIEVAAIVSRRMKQSHKRQFNGEDWQHVAAELTEDIVDEGDREIAFSALSMSPEPGCECGFCATAEWRD